MNKAIRALAVAAAATLAAGAAQAQPYGGGRGREPAATLYELPNFQGRRIEIFAAGTNLARSGFNDIAQSARFQGRWRVCEDSQFRGRCQDVSGDVADLNAIGLAGRISSLQGYFQGFDRGGFGGGRGGGWRENAWDSPSGGRPLEGARSVLFPYPNFAGYEIAAGSGAANAFCRAAGLGSAAFYDSGERAPQALDGEGRFTGETSVLRDVLCRKY